MAPESSRRYKKKFTPPLPLKKKRKEIIKIHPARTAAEEERCVEKRKKNERLKK